MSPETRKAPVRNAVEGERWPLARPTSVERGQVMLEGGEAGRDGREGATEGCECLCVESDVS